MSEEFILNDLYKLRITSKKLSSGKYQVKFYATVHQQKSLYGYALVDAGETLKAVIEKISNRLDELDYGSAYPQIHLYNSLQEPSDDMMIFEHESCEHKKVDLPVANFAKQEILFMNQA